MDNLNVGTVDCTSEGGKPLCSKMEVRGYPTLLFFPGKNENVDGPVSAIKYKGARTREEFEAFALEGGYKNVSQEDEKVPVNQTGMEAWTRWAKIQKN